MSAKQVGMTALVAGRAFTLVVVLQALSIHVANGICAIHSTRAGVCIAQSPGPDDFGPVSRLAQDLAGKVRGPFPFQDPVLSDVAADVGHLQVCVVSRSHGSVPFQAHFG